MNKFEQLKAKALENAKAARLLAEKADSENRELTTAEKSAFDAAMKAADDFVKRAKEAKADAEILAQAKALADEISPEKSAKAGGPVGRKAWGRAGVKTVREAMGRADGSKALVSGSVTMANPVSDGVAPLGAAPTSVLDLLRGEPAEGLSDEDYGRDLADYKPRIENDSQIMDAIMRGDGGGTNTFTYLRQTVRDSKAAPVADGTLKPTSIYTMEEIEDRFRVIAHLSEPFPQRYFHDDKSLGEFLANEMGYGLQRAIEQQALSGDGTGENMTGILSTSRHLSQAWSADLLTTLRKAMTALQVTGVDPTALVLHPTDAERLDLLREGVDSGKYLLGDPAAEAVRTLWTIPRVTSLAVAAGTAVLGDWAAAKLVTRQEAVLNVDTGGALFDKNQVKFRVETRAGVAIKQPGAFVEIDIAEPAA